MLFTVLQVVCMQLSPEATLHNWTLTELPCGLLQVVRWLTECGNGIVEGEEQCDDGNQESGDGCSPVCKVCLLVQCMLFGCPHGVRGANISGKPLVNLYTLQTPSLSLLETSFCKWTRDSGPGSGCSSRAEA